LVAALPHPPPDPDRGRPRSALGSYVAVAGGLVGELVGLLPALDVASALVLPPASSSSCWSRSLASSGDRAVRPLGAGAATFRRPFGGATAGTSGLLRGAGLAQQAATRSSPLAPVEPLAH
jgi:hypothetical protein